MCSHSCWIALSTNYGRAPHSWRPGAGSSPRSDLIVATGRSRERGAGAFDWRDALTPTGALAALRWCSPEDRLLRRCPNGAEPLPESLLALDASY